MAGIRKKKVVVTVFTLCLGCLSPAVLAGSITGTVTQDSNGSPVSGLWVQADDYNTHAYAGSDVTDSCGVYEVTGLSDGTYRVSIDTSGTEYVAEYYNDASFWDDATAVEVIGGGQVSSIDFGLAVGGSISGRITDVNGLALEGVGVNLYRGTDPLIADQHAWYWVAGTSTDANGDYQFEDLAERRYRVHVYDQEVSGTHYFEADLYNVQVFAGVETVDMDITLRRAGLIYGYIKTAGGTPINAEVVANAAWTEAGWGWHGTWTDSSGRYELWLAPSPGKFYPVWVRNASLGGVSYENKWDGEFHKATPAGTRVDYVLEQAGKVTGRVENEYSVGIEDVRVNCGWNKYVIDDGDWEVTDSNGYFELGGLPPGIVYVYVDNSWREIQQDGVKYMVGDAYAGPIDIAAGDVCDVGTFIIYEAGMVTGVVTDEAGFPVVGAEVELEGKDIEGNWADRDAVYTDSFGQFTVDYAAPGEYVLSCERAGFIMSVEMDIVVDRGQHVERDMVLKSSAEGATMTGMIANYNDVALYDSENGVYYPYYDDSDYEDWDLPEFELLAVRADISPTEKDLLDPERMFVAWVGDDAIDDGYGDYFEQDPCETRGYYEMALPSGDIAVAMCVHRDLLPGWGGCAILHDWKRFDFAKGDVRDDVNFTVVTTDTGTLKGDINVPAGYEDFPEDWCLIFAYALDANDNPKTGIPLSDAAAFPGWTTQYEFRNLPAGNYQLKAYARNLASVLDLPPVTVVADTNTILNISFTSGSTLTGHITDANSGIDVNMAVVTIEETGKQATTDDSGNYTIKGINAGFYTVSASAPGYADAEVADVNIEPNSTKVLNFALDSTVGSISGTVKTADGNNINGATLLAYNETDGTYDTTETVGGAFSIADLTPGEYILAVDTDDLGYGVVTYPPDPNRITLAPDGEVNDVNIVVETLQPPLFTVYSSASNDVPPVLSLEFHSDLPLNAEPNITVIDGNGTLGDVAPNPANNRFTIVYDACESDNLVRINIAETDPLVPGNAASKTFSFEVGSNLVQTSSTNVTNATGGEGAIMGTQDNTKIYVPPFAIAGANDTQALTLTIERYGDPGDAVEGSNDTTASAVYDFEFDDEGVTIDVDHTFTVTMSFQLPEGMSQEEFEATLEIRYFDAGDQQWKTDGISNVRINWANNTIMFEISHLTKFAAFVEVSTYHPADTNSDWRIVIGEVTAYGACWKTGCTWSIEPNQIPISYVTRAGYIWKIGETYCYDPCEGPPLCWDFCASGAGQGQSMGVATKSVAASESTSRTFDPGQYTSGQPVSVCIVVEPDTSTQTYAMEDAPPAGWTVGNISEGGVWDSVNSKVKWGPFFDNHARTLCYEATPPSDESGEKTFAATYSADGAEVAVARQIDSQQSEHPDLTGECTLGRLRGPVDPGDTVRAGIVITNIGSVATAHGQRIDIEVCVRPCSTSDDSQDTLIMTLSDKSVSRLRMGRSKKYGAKVTLPAGLDGGEYRLVAKIDCSDDVDESDESNNSAVSVCFEIME